MTQATTGPIVVGVDFSTPSEAAIAHGVWEAAAQHRGLHLLHAYDSIASGVPPITGYEASMKRDAHERLESIAARVRQTHPDLDVTTRVWIGSAAGALLDASASAAMVVVGARGLGGFRRLLVGSVAAQVAGHALCPVAVVRAATSGSNDDTDEEVESSPAVATGPILVGVDGSGYAVEAIDEAFAGAARRGTAVVALNVWASFALQGLTADRSWGNNDDSWVEQLDEDADRMLSEALSGAVGAHPEVAVTRRAVRGSNPAEALIDTAERVGASQIVVGSRGRGGFTGLMLGSVSQELLSHSPITVVVVRGDKPPVD